MPLSLDGICIVQRTQFQKIMSPGAWKWERGWWEGRGAEEGIGNREGRGVDRKNWEEGGDQGRWLLTDKPGWV